MEFSARDILTRILLSALAALVFAILISEGTYLFLKEETDRAPERIELVIPPGTAEKIAAGEAVNTIPTGLTFVQGDTLVVKNDDDAHHQLGPIWVPPGTTGSMVLDQANQYSYSCSFQSDRYIDLDVYPRLTWGTRLNGILMIALPSIPLIGVYSFVLFPGKRKELPGGQAVEE